MFLRLIVFSCALLLAVATARARSVTATFQGSCSPGEVQKAVADFTVRRQSTGTTNVTFSLNLYTSAPNNEQFIYNVSCCSFSNFGLGKYPGPTRCLVGGNWCGTNGGNGGYCYCDSKNPSPSRCASFPLEWTTVFKCPDDAPHCETRCVLYWQNNDWYSNQNVYMSINAVE